MGAALLVAPTVSCVGSDNDAGDEAPPAVSPAEGVYGMAPASKGGRATVVTLRPVAGASVPARIAADPSVDQFGLAFSPRRILVNPGTITFTNSESALTHNVRVESIDSGASLLDADAVPGDALTLEVLDEGGYDVLCDMHPGMSAFVFVTDAPYAVFVEDDGSFELGVAPPGDYVARAWTADIGFHPPVSITVGPRRTGVDLRPSG